MFVIVYVTHTPSRKRVERNAEDGQVKLDGRVQTNFPDTK